MKRYFPFAVYVFLLASSYAYAQAPQVLWTRELRGDVSSPVIADIDGDGRKEIIADAAGFVYVFDKNGTLRWSYMTAGGARQYIQRGLRTALSVADLNNDSKKEIIYPSKEGKLYVLDSKGEVLWKFVVLGATNRIADIESAPAIADINGDGVPDVIISATDGNIYTSSGKNGNEIWTLNTRELASKFWFFKSNLRHGITIISSPSVGDIDGDGKPEVLVAIRGSGSFEPRVLVINADDVSLLWSFKFGYASDASPSIADLNGDGAYEVIIGDGESLEGGGNGKKMYALEGKTGRLLWMFQGDGGFDASPSIGDINGDGKPEIVASTLWGAKTYALSNKGILLWNHTAGDEIYSTAALADANGDGIADVIVGSNDNHLYALNGITGKEIWRLKVNGRVYSSPAVSDIDNDRKGEIVFGAGYTLYAIKANVSGDWPKFKRDLENSGNLEGVAAGKGSLVILNNADKDFFYKWLFKLSNIAAAVKNRLLG